MSEASTAEEAAAEPTAVGGLILEVLGELAREDVLSMGNLEALGEDIVLHAGDEADEALLRLLQDALIACRAPSAAALDKVDAIWELYEGAQQQQQGQKTKKKKTRGGGGVFSF